jgi:hypothetical protein
VTLSVSAFHSTGGRMTEGVAPVTRVECA